MGELIGSWPVEIIAEYSLYLPSLPGEQLGKLYVVGGREKMQRLAIGKSLGEFTFPEITGDEHLMKEGNEILTQEAWEKQGLSL